MIKLELSDTEKEGLSNEEIEIAKARKLELQILPLLRRNINFFYAGANFPKKSKAYNRPINEKEIDNAISGKQQAISVVCKPLCEMVVNILKENGLNAETISCDTDMFRHTDVLLTTSAGKQYIINYLEDMENVQSGMKTPDFASKAYYERRYQKFEGGLTTDGKSLDNINFLSSEQLNKIDKNLGYKKFGMYLDDVIEQIRKEFENFREITAENEYLTKVLRLEKNGQVPTENEKKQIRERTFEKYKNMTDDEILEQKLDWIFNYFNERMDITGHTDFVMYYSRLLLSKVLSAEEYKKLTRYDCFVRKDDVPENSQIENILDYNNTEEEDKFRFCLLQYGDKAYAFSTKPNVYVKLNGKDLEQLSQYSKLSKSEKPSDLVLNLCDRGNAVPLLFHPLGSKLLNERAAMISSNLSEDERKREIEKLANSIIGTDGEITSITIPYPNGEEIYIYINENNEFTTKTTVGTTIYHYNEETDSFETELVDEELEK